MDDAGWNPKLTGLLKARGYQVNIIANGTYGALGLPANPFSIKWKTDILDPANPIAFTTPYDTRLECINDTDLIGVYCKFSRALGANPLTLYHLNQADSLTQTVNDGETAFWWADSQGNLTLGGTEAEEWNFSIIIVITKGEP